MKTVIKKIMNSYWGCLLFNIVYMLLLFLICTPKYETNDDAIIASLVDKTHNFQDAHVVYQNIILGKLYVFLYGVLGTSIEWYTIIQYTVLLFSFAAIIFVINERLPLAHSLLANGIILLIFAYDGYVNIQFTKTAAVATCAGMLLLLHVIRSQKIKWIRYVGGMLFLALGMCYRMEAFLISFCLMLGIGIVLLADLKLEDKETRRRKIFRYFGTLAAVVILLLGVFFIDYVSYCGEEWKYYKEYNSVRSELIDYGIPDYNAHQEEYEKLNIYRDAFAMFIDWNFDDPEVFSLDTMEQMVQMKDKKHITLYTGKVFLYDMILGVFTQKIFYSVMLCIPMWLFFHKKGIGTWLSFLYAAIVFLVMYFYLYYMGRYFLNRVDYGFCLAFILTLSWTLSESKEQISTQTSCMLLMCTLFLVQAGWQEGWKLQPAEKEIIEEERKAERNELYQLIQNDDTHIYFSKVGLIPLADSFQMPDGMLDKMYWLGGWKTNYPEYERSMKQKGIDNPFRYLTEHDEAYIIDHDIETTIEYIRSYYNENASYELINQIGYYKIYAIK